MAEQTARIITQDMENNKHIPYDLIKTLKIDEKNRVHQS